MSIPSITVRRVNYQDTTDRAALCTMLNAYAQDPMGGGEPLGLVNCFEGYSTFKGQTLINIHDIAVHESARGRGVGQAVFLQKWL